MAIVAPVAPNIASAFHRNTHYTIHPQLLSRSYRKDTSFFAPNIAPAPVAVAQTSWKVLLALAAEAHNHYESLLDPIEETGYDEETGYEIQVGASTSNHHQF